MSLFALSSKNTRTQGPAGLEEKEDASGKKKKSEWVKEKSSSNVWTQLNWLQVAVEQ